MDKRFEFFEQYKRLYNALQIAFSEGFADKEITFVQYRVLSILKREPRLSSAEVARRTYVSAQAANVIIARLEALRLIRRKPATSGRLLEATLTKRGETVYADCAKVSLSLGKHIFDLVPQRDMETMLSVVATLAEALDRPEKVRPLRAWTAALPSS